MTKKKTYAIGIDIGGTNSVAGVVDTDGRVIGSASVRTQAYPVLTDYVAAVAQMVMGLLAEHGITTMEVRGIGVGAPNANYYRGTIEMAPNLPWKEREIPLARLLGEALDGLPVVMTNDANAAAWGEKVYGAAKDMDHFIMITLGTGVGGGVVTDGRLMYGNDGLAGELGHLIVERDGRLCGCGRRGCLEAYCSATGVARTARERLAATSEDSLLRSIERERLTSKDVYEAAVKGDRVATEIFRETGTILGRALADMTAFANPEAFVLFGGLAKAGDYIRRYTEEALEENLMPVFKGRVRVVTSGLRDADAAVLGAAALVRPPSPATH